MNFGQRPCGRRSRDLLGAIRAHCDRLLERVADINEAQRRVILSQNFSPAERKQSERWSRQPKDGISMVHELAGQHVRLPLSGDGGGDDGVETPSESQPLVRNVILVAGCLHRAKQTGNSTVT